MYFLVYVDDLIITGNNSVALQGFIDQLSLRFSVKDPGSLSYFLGVEVDSHAGGPLSLSEKKTSP